MKKILNEKTILLLILCIVTLLTIVIASVAWYLNNMQTKLQTGQISIASDRNFLVALSQGGKDVSELSEEEKKIDMGLGAFSNIETGKLAPGTYGQFDLYITSLSDTVMGCQFSLVYNYENNSEQGALPTNVDFSNLLATHLSFSTDADFEIILTNTQKMSVALVPDTETKVTIYWKWAYEYEGLDIVQLTPEQLVTKKENYDSEDSLIGKYIQSINFQLTVEGYQMLPNKP